MTGLFARPAPTPVAAAAKSEDPAAAARARQQAELDRKAKGRASTLLGGAEGDTSAAPVARPTLLGG